MLNNIIRDFYLNGNHVKFYLQNLENGNKTIILQLKNKVVLIASETSTGISVLEKKKGWSSALNISIDCLNDELIYIIDKYSDIFEETLDIRKALEYYREELEEKRKVYELKDTLEILKLL